MRYLLHDVFTRTVKSLPHNVAIICESGKTYTYSELNRISNKFANLFKELKGEVRENPYVGILSAVNPESISAVLGILKIGGAYIPLDEYSPSERLGYIVRNTSLDVIVVDARWFDSHFELMEMDQIKKVIIIGDSTQITNVSNKTVSFEKVMEYPLTEIQEINQVSNDLAYILHSSGSTGVPKGIMLTHRNARTFVDWMQKEFKLTKDDVVMSRAPFKFDLSVFDIFNTFNVGAKLVCFDWNKHREGDEKHIDYVKLMEGEEATVIYTTPSTFISLLNRGNLGDANLKLREIMYAGEPFPTPQLRRLYQALPRTRIANIYGPTETNIVTYYWVDRIPEDDSPIPLGDVVEDTEIIVVSEDMKRICEPNELGELWCRGGTVTIGYLGLEEKTKECLVKSPFHKYPVFYWRTGDFGYRDEDGCLHYNGRRDHMIKVKGFRIELGEIETAISSFNGIDEFVVVAVPDEKYGNRLYCYYSILKDKRFSAEDLVKHLQKKIPEYMIPYKFEVLQNLPKTSSGKVDRVLLAEQAKEDLINGH